MTNEQAIIELRDLISDDRTDRENEALLLAIEKLRDKRPTRQVNCSHCDYLNFSEKIIDIIVEVMTKYGIERVEDLHRELDRLRGGEEE